jgi:hypothetical protein
MSVEPIGFLILILGLVAVLRGPSVGFLIFIPCTLLGSAAVIKSDAVSIQPAHLLLGVLILTVFRQRRYIEFALRGLSFPLPGFWLLCTMIYGVVGAVLLPRILAGITLVYTIGRSSSGQWLYPVPLEPTTGNFTQSVYFCGDVACFLLCYSFASTAAGFRIIFRALFYYAVGNIIFAALDLVTFWTGTGYLLEFIRNSSYVLHTDTVVLGLKRIAGSFTEASSFAGTTIGIVGFTARLWLFNIVPTVTFPIALISLLLLLLSTSTTAYATAPLLLLYLYFGSAWRITISRVGLPAAAFVVLSPLLLGIAIIVVLLQPSVASSINDLMGVLIFDKSSSQSGIERAMLNEVALANLFDTFGLGTGIGSAKASSFALAMLATLGVIGSTAYCLFLYKVLVVSRQPSDQWIAKVRTSARTACFGLLCASVLSGTGIDLGLPFFIFAGLSCAFPSTESAQAIRLTLKNNDERTAD